MDEIERLQAKLKAREGQPGFKANVEAIKAEIARLESLTYQYRDNATGQFVTAEYALANPDTTHRVEI
jgi:uncharacterized small protein (DUF1192 family)